MTTRVRNFQREETVPIWAEIKTWAGVYSTPDQGVKITITDPDGTVQVNAVSMGAAVDTGKFTYHYLTISSSVLGWWRIMCKAQDGLAADAKYTIAYGGFTLQN